MIGSLKWAIAFTVSLGTILEVIDTSIINVALNEQLILKRLYYLTQMSFGLLLWYFSALYRYYSFWGNASARKHPLSLNKFC
ncbi:MAG: hypothetical protein ACR2LR_05035 [Hassallia sp.]